MEKRKALKYEDYQNSRNKEEKGLPTTNKQ